MLRIALTFLAVWIFPCLNAEQKLLLMRHGEGEQNVADVWDKNAPLTQEGIRKVQGLARDLLKQGYTKDNISHVFISPIPRVLETAQICIDAGLIDPSRIIVERRITRRDMGKFEGEKVIHWDGKKDDLPHIKEYEVETIEKIHERVGDFYQDLMKSYLDGHVLIITHGSITRELMEFHRQDRVRLDVSEVRILELYP